MSHLLKSRSRNSAFTLVELMIVIAIIGILASLATVGVMKVLERSKMVTARIEVSQLEAAVSAAKLDLGNVDELPSVIYLVKNIPDFASPTALTGESAVQKAIRDKTWSTIQKVFGRNVGKDTSTNTYYTSTNIAKTINWPGTDKVIIEGMEAYMFWLGGVYNNTGGKYSFSGFSTDKRDPCETTSSKRKGPYFDFDSSRVIAGTNHLSYTNSWGGEYAYFSNSLYKTYLPDTGTSVNLVTKTGGSLLPYKNGSVFFNTKTFQLISSGPNLVFGPGGSGWTPGSGKYAIEADGYDDLSNFSSTQLGKKDE
jgi:prepilin-type N-terminal cleavage/methylation domain-containing protein